MNQSTLNMLRFTGLDFLGPTPLKILVWLQDHPGQSFRKLAIMAGVSVNAINEAVAKLKRYRLVEAEDLPGRKASAKTLRLTCTIERR